LGASAVVRVGERLREFVRAAVGVLTLPSSVVSVYKVATYLTRLETRTKESNMPASEWVTKPRRAMKVKSACRSTHDPVSIGAVWCRHDCLQCGEHRAVVLGPERW